VNFPNNPTGALPSRQEWAEIVSVARAANCHLFGDEVYRWMEYDPAHRLTDIADALGNTLHYTLDALGNRLRDDVRDPAQQLARTRHGHHRPLLHDTDPEARLRLLMSQRAALYEEIADITVSTDERKAQAVAQEIQQAIRRAKER
jgi:YD repeat-containing protein